MATKPDPLLSANWINARVDRVMDQIEEIFDHLIDDELLASGVFPFEEKITPKIERLLAQQAEAALSGQETIPTI